MLPSWPLLVPNHAGTQRSRASVARRSGTEFDACLNDELAGGKPNAIAYFGVKVLRAALNSARNELITATPPMPSKARAGRPESGRPALR